LLFDDLRNCVAKSSLKAFLFIHVGKLQKNYDSKINGQQNGKT